MKKILTSLLFISIFIPSIAGAFSISAPATISGTSADKSYWIYMQGGGGDSIPICSANGEDFVSEPAYLDLDYTCNFTGNDVNDTLIVIETNFGEDEMTGEICNGVTLDDCRNSPDYISEVSFLFPPGGGGGGGDDSAFGSLIASATSGFGSTTGFSLDGLTSWAGNNLIKLFIGSGIAIVFSLRFWIAALAVIGAIIYFSYRAFKFFRT